MCRAFPVLFGYDLSIGGLMMNEMQARGTHGVAVHTVAPQPFDLRGADTSDDGLSAEPSAVERGDTSRSGNPWCIVPIRSVERQRRHACRARLPRC
jgi:hypothetical protein